MGARTYRTVLIGSGNVASFLKEHIASPFEVMQVKGRSLTQSSPKGKGLKSLPLGEAFEEAALYIIAVSDRAIPSVAEELKDVKGLVVHTAGSVPMEQGYAYDKREAQIPASCCCLLLQLCESPLWHHSRPSCRARHSFPVNAPAHS